MILITGGLGFIGTHVTRALLSTGESCVLAQRRDAGLPALLAEPGLGAGGASAVVAQVDVTDRAALLELGDKYEITGIVHLAVSALGPDGPIGNARNEFTGLLNILEAAAQWNVARVGLASTIGVYNGVDAPVLREDMPLPMASGHAIPAFKKAGELLADHIAAAADLEIVSYRVAGIWGPLGRPAALFFAAPQLVHAAVRGTAPDFSTLRAPAFAEDGMDLCYVKDCGRAIALLQTAERLNHRVYNVASGRVTTNTEVMAAVRSAIPDARFDLPAGRNPRGPAQAAHLDITRLHEDTGYVPEYGTDRAVADYVAWLRAGNER